MTQIPIEAKVECVDGPCGKSVAVIVHPIQRKVTHVVVDDKTAHRLVPMDQVADASSDSVRLRCSQAQLAEMDPFVETHYIETKQSVMPVAGMMHAEYMPPLAMVDETVWTEVAEERLPLGHLAIHLGASVKASDGPVGKIGELVVDRRGEEITHFVLQEGHLWGKKVVTLPLSAIDYVEEDTVYLKLDKRAIKQLPTIPLKRSRWYAEPEMELVVKVYDEPGKAEEALEFVHDLHKQRTVKIRNAAILARDAEGAVTVRDTRDIDTKKGRLLGAITGGLIGLVGGPAGMVVGALTGAGACAVAGKRIDLGFSDKFLGKLQAHLQPGSEALVVLVEHEFAVPLSESLAHDEGIIVQQTLTDKLVEELMAGES
jgi:uncharacterized membrane protein